MLAFFVVTSVVTHKAHRAVAVIRESNEIRKILKKYIDVLNEFVIRRSREIRKVSNAEGRLNGIHACIGVLTVCPLPDSPASIQRKTHNLMKKYEKLVATW